MVGTSLQAVTRNPLADPHLLGISAGGTFGDETAATLGSPVARFRFSVFVIGALIIGGIFFVWLLRCKIG